MGRSFEVEVIRRDFEGKITDWLTHDEFRCKCAYRDCTYTLVNYRVLTAFKNVRKHWGHPILVTSGFRCQKHNADSSGVKDSWHKKGSAIDLRPTSGRLEDLYFMANKFFDLVIYYERDNFIHCQMEDK